MNNFLHLDGFLILMCLAVCFSTIVSQEHTKVTIVQTSRDGDNLAEKGTFTLSEPNEVELPVIKLKLDVKYQKITGFGGAFTESTGYVLSQLDENKRMEVIKAYFSPDGANYSFTRTHINSCDFSLDNYAYDEVAGDVNLDNFSIERDQKYLIPLIKDAMEISIDGFNILASPWTAPPWMKDNNDWNDGSLKPEYYPVWALYFSKYIKAYEKEGIPIWGVTIENEPNGNGAQWESMIYTPEQTADFIKNNLGPQFTKDGIDAEIMYFDHNRDDVVRWANIVLNDPEAAKYIWGTAVHWYSSTITWNPAELNKVHEIAPDKGMMHTEGCIDSQVPVWHDDKWYWSKNATDWGYDWASEEEKPMHPMYKPVFRYAQDIIGGLNNWLTGWIDWNMVLDDKGGPNHAENWCIAPVIVKPETGEVYYTPLYYIMCHFSKYIRPGATRIGLSSGDKDLKITACQNPNNDIVVEVFNPMEREIKYRFQVGDKAFDYSIPANALQTIIVN